jgi:sporulation protein YlmC with PRC-barrel domain
MSANTPRSGEIATDETHNLISADKVTGTSVFNRQGEKLGSVYSIMLNKTNGQVAYAIMSFGGFLGMGESYHPLPWKVLKYDPRQDGYVVDLDRNRLEAAPSYTARNEPNWSDRAYGQSVDTYYGSLVV